MRDLVRCALAFFVRDATLAASYPVAFALGVASTLGRVLALWLPAQFLVDSPIFREHGGFIPFSLVGTSMMSIFMASYGGFANAVRNEQAMGTLEALLMTRVTIPAIVLGSNLWTIAYAVFEALVMLGAGALAFGLVLRGNLLAAVVVMVLTNLCFAAVGIVSAAFAVVFKRGDPFRVVVGGASFLIGGVIYPTEILPKWVETVAQVLPITHGARALRGILIDGHSLMDYQFEVGVLAAFALVGLPLGVLSFARAVRQAKRDGSLLQY